MGFYICAVVQAQEGKIDQLLSLVDKIFERVQSSEPDTLQYQIVTNSQKPNEIVVWEEYTDEAAFNFHCAGEAFQTFKNLIPEICEGGKIELKKIDLRSSHLAKSRL